MNLGKEAERFADSLFDRIPELVMMSIQQRRKDACWHKVKCQRRRKTCHPVWRPWWDWRVKAHDSRCHANQHCDLITNACLAYERELGSRFV